MMKLLSQLTKSDLENKKVFLRVDFNVAREGNEGEKIVEDFKIRSHQKTIDYLLECGAQVACVSYTSEKGWSYEPIAQQISEILGHPLFFVPSIFGKDLIAGFEKGSLVLSENVRLYKEEKDNDTEHAKKLAEGFDIYINDAFASSHRAEASLVAITTYLPYYAGFVMEQETKELGDMLDTPSVGKVVVLGGKKIESKITVVENFLERAEHILIGGAVANNFLKLQGKDIGKSVYDPDKMDLIKNLDLSRLTLPIDSIIADDMILDIGPESRKLFTDIIGKATRVIWSGAMGMFEKSEFAGGTKAIAQAVGGATHSIIGGGDTILAADELGLREKYSYVSTGGGAMLEFLSGKRLPALEALGYYD